MNDIDENSCSQNILHLPYQNPAQLLWGAKHSCHVCVSGGPAASRQLVLLSHRLSPLLPAILNPSQHRSFFNVFFAVSLTNSVLCSPGQALCSPTQCYAVTISEYPSENQTWQSKIHENPPFQSH